MGIEVKHKPSDETVYDVFKKNRKLIIFKWDHILQPGFSIISEKIFFNFDFSIKYKSSRDNDKIILLGEFNNKFWFYRIMNGAHEPRHVFGINKPLSEPVNSIKVYLIDWYHIINKFQPKNIEIEYAVVKE